jgi:hypothetical protein
MAPTRKTMGLLPRNTAYKDDKDVLQTQKNQFFKIYILYVSNQMYLESKVWFLNLTDLVLALRSRGCNARHHFLEPQPETQTIY